MSMRIESPSPMIAPIVTGQFDEDPSYQTYRSRGTQDWLLICTLGGKGEFRTDGQTHIALKGDVHILPQGAPHDYRTAQDGKHWKFIWSHFIPMPHWTRWLSFSNIPQPLYHIHFDDRSTFLGVESALESAHRYASSPGRFGKELAMNALEAALILCAISLNEGQTPLDPRIAKSIDDICLSLNEPWTLTRLAGMASLSESRFATLFRTQMKVTPQQYIEARRIERAKQLLALSSRTVQEIAAEVGYENGFYFSNRFKAAVGLSPTRYRQVANRPPVPVSGTPAA